MGTPPIFPNGNTGGRGGDLILLLLLFFNPSVLLTPPSFGHLPYILLRKTPRNATGHGRGGG